MSTTPLSLKNEGNAHFSEDRFEQAITKYTEALSLLSAEGSIIVTTDNNNLIISSALAALETDNDQGPPPTAQPLQVVLYSNRAQCLLSQEHKFQDAAQDAARAVLSSSSAPAPRALCYKSAFRLLTALSRQTDNAGSLRDALVGAEVAVKRWGSSSNKNKNKNNNTNVPADAITNFKGLIDRLKRNTVAMGVNWHVGHWLYHSGPTLCYVCKSPVNNNNSSNNSRAFSVSSRCCVLASFCCASHREAANKEHAPVCAMSPQTAGDFAELQEAAAAVAGRFDASGASNNSNSNLGIVNALRMMWQMKQTTDRDKKEVPFYVEEQLRFFPRCVCCGGFPPSVTCGGCGLVGACQGCAAARKKKNQPLHDAENCKKLSVTCRAFHAVWRARKASYASLVNLPSESSALLRALSAPIQSISSSNNNLWDTVVPASLLKTSTGGEEPDVQLALARDSLSWPLSIAVALMQAPLQLRRQLRQRIDAEASSSSSPSAAGNGTLVVHVVGAELECTKDDVWESLLHLLGGCGGGKAKSDSSGAGAASASAAATSAEQQEGEEEHQQKEDPLAGAIRHLHVVFIGPSVSESLMINVRGGISSKLLNDKLCGDCSKHSCSLKLSFARQTWEQFMSSQQRITNSHGKSALQNQQQQQAPSSSALPSRVPHIVVAFNAGIHNYTDANDESIWRPALEAMCAQLAGIPCLRVVTCYDRGEAQMDRAIVADVVAAFNNNKSGGGGTTSGVIKKVKVSDIFANPLASPLWKADTTVFDGRLMTQHRYMFSFY